MTNQYQKKQQIYIGNFFVSIGTYDTSEVAIFSKYSGEAVKLRQAKVSKKLKRIKRHLKSWLSCEDRFYFSHMTPTLTSDVVEILKKGKLTKKD